MARVQDKVNVKSMIDLVPVKKDMLCYVQDVRADCHVVLWKVRLVGEGIKRREVVV